jgi:multiple sugar transport system substrate-binding protein
MEEDMKKKLIPVLVLVCCGALLAVFGGCAKKDGGAGSSGEKTITFIGWEASPLETQAVKNGIAKFEAANPGIKVQYTPTSGDYNAKLLASIAGNSAPDVFFAGSDTYRTLVKRGVLLDITDRFGSSFPLDDFIESSRTIMTVNGRVYGISSCSVSPIIYYNKDIFDKAGVPYPAASLDKIWTIDEFRAIAKRLTGNGNYGIYGLETINDTLAAQLVSAGGNKFNSDYTKSAMNSPQAKRVLQMIKAIRVEDGSAPSAAAMADNAGMGGMNAKQMLQTGKVAMLMDGSWSLQELSTLNFPVGIAPLPSYGNPVTVGQAHLHVISKNTKYPEEAWKFLQFLSGMDYQGQLCREGLWLPNRYSLWEDGPNGIDGWYDDERLGPYYREMKTYLRDAVVDPSALQKANICTDIIREECERYLKEDLPVDQALANIEKRTNTELAALD